MAEVQDKVAEAFARRCAGDTDDGLTPGILSGLTLSILAVTFRSWFAHGEPDISRVSGRIFETLSRLVCPPQPPGPQPA